jgi:hypothetical protein
MNPIDKLNELDYTEAFDNKDADHFEPGIFCIFSDNGHIWHVGTLTGIEDTADGCLYRNEETLQYKHCRIIKPSPACCQAVIVSHKCADDYYKGLIIGEDKDRWLITCPRGVWCVPKSNVAFIDGIKFGGEA